MLELRRADQTRHARLSLIQGTGEVSRETQIKKTDAFEQKSGRTLRARTRNLVHTAVRRAKSMAAGAVVAGLLVGATLTAGCSTLAHAQVVTPPNGGVVQVDTSRLTAQQQAERAAVNELRELHRTGKLDDYFQRDGATGAYVEPRAMDLFNRLPVIGPDTKAEDLVALGLLQNVPRGLDQLELMPQYVTGKQVFVRTSTNSDRDSRNWNRFEAGGTERITHHGTLVDMNGDKFVVEVAKKGGGTQRIEVAKDEIFQLNQASSPEGLKDNVNGIDVDYQNPVVRAKIAQGFLLIADELAKLDFTKPADDRTNRSARLAIVKKLFWNQKSEYVADHHKDWQRVGTMANLLNGGVGVCTDQGTTQWAYFQPFEKIAGFRILNVSGATIDLDRGHNFNILWLAGSEEMFVTDRTWNGGNEHPTVNDAMDQAGWNKNRYVVAPNDRTQGDMEIPARSIKMRN